ELMVKRTPNNAWKSYNRLSNEPVRLSIEESSAQSLSLTISREDIDKSIKNLRKGVVRSDIDYEILHFQQAHDSDVKDMDVTVTPVATPESSKGAQSIPRRNFLSLRLLSAAVVLTVIGWAFLGGSSTASAAEIPQAVQAAVPHVSATTSHFLGLGAYADVALGVVAS